MNILLAYFIGSEVCGKWRLDRYQSVCYLLALVLVSGEFMACMLLRQNPQRAREASLIATYLTLSTAYQYLHADLPFRPAPFLCVAGCLVAILSGSVPQDHHDVLFMGCFFHHVRSYLVAAQDYRLADPSLLQDAWNLLWIVTVGQVSMLILDGLWQRESVRWADVGYAVVLPLIFSPQEEFARRDVHACMPFIHTHVAVGALVAAVHASQED